MKKYNLGFTLVEIIVAVGLIGILTTTGFVSYTASMKNSRDAKRKTDLETIRQALELYKSDNGSYPSVTTGTAQYLKTPLASPTTYLNTNSFPNDPKSTSGDIYFFNRTSTNTYYLCTYLENVPATNTCASTGTNCNTTPTVTHTCNYGVRQP